MERVRIPSLCIKEQISQTLCALYRLVRRDLIAIFQSQIFKWDSCLNFSSAQSRSLFEDTKEPIVLKRTIVVFRKNIEVVAAASLRLPSKPI